MAPFQTPLGVHEKKHQNLNNKHLYVGGDDDSGDDGLVTNDDDDF